MTELTHQLVRTCFCSPKHQPSASHIITWHNKFATIALHWTIICIWCGCEHECNIWWWWRRGKSEQLVENKLFEFRARGTINRPPLAIECAYDTVSIHVRSTMQCPSIRIFRTQFSVWGGRRMDAGRARRKSLYFDFHLRWLFVERGIQRSNCIWQTCHISKSKDSLFFFDQLMV